MKELIKAILKRTPYRIVRRGDLNRFDAIEEMMLAMRRRGFSPSRIIDGGANIGAFAKKAANIYSSAFVDMIEPQPECLDQLHNLSAARGFSFHPVALVGPSYSKGTISLNISPGEVTTGAHISIAQNANSVDVRAATLDSIFANVSLDNERIFLKLDLQGYELEALAGGEKTLERTEVILTEVSFFAQAYEPPIVQIMDFLDARHFELYDVAALGARARDGRARQGDFIFVRRDSALSTDKSWS
ncbi:FkbM family methyltransferase [Methylocystis sp. WRRC1]|uniref:FkbM family methyltransferase n=1 Tax=Methylocystis sp. WRRC1 TaxID=1732014 RepID=UPI001D137E15|nr:FkbM family methyltransferase [Methylocystis sp. WRRC1]MCC3244462.1 FkbM family methyltransferase [Methylocystis sp. WRRC1]